MRLVLSSAFSLEWALPADWIRAGNSRPLRIVKHAGRNEPDTGTIFYNPTHSDGDWHDVLVHEYIHHLQFSGMQAAYRVTVKEHRRRTSGETLGPLFPDHAERQDEVGRRDKYHDPWPAVRLLT